MNATVEITPTKPKATVLFGTVADVVQAHDHGLITTTEARALLGLPAPGGTT